MGSSRISTSTAMAWSAAERAPFPLAERVARSDRVAVIFGVTLLILLGWASLYFGVGMAAMGPAPFAAVTVMWWEMMTAMMLPSATPAILLYGRNAARHPVMGPSWQFVSGYLLAWLGFSIAAAALQVAAVRNGLVDAMALRTSGRVTAALWIAAGIYQLTPLKTACLSHCRSPAGFFARHWRAGRFGAIRLGIGHGFYCIGCCGALMALLLVGGVMNLLWVAAIATVVALEKLAPRGDLIARAAGVAMLAWGAFSLLR